jgi:hypothetical protein
MLADDYYNESLNSNKKLHQIINEWVKIIEAEKQEGIFTLPDYLVSSYIRGKLRDRNVSHGNIDLVDDFIDKKYKNPKYSHPHGSDTTANDNQSLQYLEDIYRDFISDDEFNRLSSAEKQAYIYGIDDKIKRVKKVCNDQLKRNDELAIKHHIPIYEKQSSEEPPEWFWGESATRKELELMMNDSLTLYKYFQAAWILCKKFKPSGPVDIRAAEEFRQYRINEWDNYKRFVVGVIEKLKHQWVKVVDEKNRETLSGWMDIGIDKFLNYGSHASGVLNAIDIGKSVLRLKGDELYTVELERPFTKEIVGDNTAGKLLVESRDFARGCHMEQGINIWTKETRCDILLVDPTKFMQDRMKDPSIQVLSGDENKTIQPEQEVNSQ